MRNTIGFSATAGLQIERIDQPEQAIPGHYLIHLGEEAFAAVCFRLPVYSKSEKLIWCCR
jgi:hypothetical protein